MCQDNIDKIINAAQIKLQKKDNVLIAIDGRCGAGKTTFAQKFQEKTSCNVIHMDDFFLRLHQRTKERYDTPGGNIDHERFLREVLLPLKKNVVFSYRPFNCSTCTLGDLIKIEPNKITVVEGSYSCHPQLWDFYDIHVFADIDKDTQLQRIANRNNEASAAVFQSRWIPFEESYFSAFNIKERCEFSI